MSEKWWEKGVQFECQGSGKCCVSRGDYGYVYVTLKDRQHFAKHLKMSTQKFTRSYCQKSDGLYHLKGDGPCVFMDGKRCGVYEARPTQCRTWPFWPEVMKPKQWQKEVASFCPGVGKGRVWSKEEITEVMNIQRQADAED